MYDAFTSKVLVLTSQRAVRVLVQQISMYQYTGTCAGQCKFKTYSAECQLLLWDFVLESELLVCIVQQVLFVCVFDRVDLQGKWGDH
jgi:hypothetical protein